MTYRYRNAVRILLELPEEGPLSSLTLLQDRLELSSAEFQHWITRLVSERLIEQSRFDGSSETLFRLTPSGRDMKAEAQRRDAVNAVDATAFLEGYLGDEEDGEEDLHDGMSAS